MMAGDEEVSASSQEMDGRACPMYFGVSCAFVALHLVSRRRGLDIEHGRWSHVGELMLRGSAQLLGLLVGRAQRTEEVLSEKLRKAELEVEELKRRRAEDAKANEKVVGIFAAHEQSWIAERRSLRHQIQALVGEMRALKAKHEEAVSDLKRRVEEGECALRIKDEAFEEEGRQRKQLEEKLRSAEALAEESTERANKEAQDHAAELWKHKTALVELVSNQRQLEAEMGRALRQAEAARQELEEAFQRKEEAVAMVGKLSGEMSKLQKDAEQKDKILSAMLRKSKLDTAEKQMLLKEVKISKAKKKQAELETERWRSMWESRHRKSSRAPHSLEASCSQNRRAEPHAERKGYAPETLLLDYLEAESRRDHESSAAKGENIIATVECLDECSSYGNYEPATEDFEQLQDWVRLETEKYATVLERRHQEEIEAFTEQMRLKDEKLEAFRWRFLSMELESKQLQSHMEGLDGNLSHLREENIKLEALLLDKEKELKSLKEQFSFHLQHLQKSNSSSSPRSDASDSRMKMAKRKPREKEQDPRANVVKDIQKEDRKTQEIRESQNSTEEARMMNLELQKTSEFACRESTSTDTTTTSSTNLSSLNNPFEDNGHVCAKEPSPEEPETARCPSGKLALRAIPSSPSPREEIEEEKEVSMDPGNARLRNNFQLDTDITDKLSSVGPSLAKKDSSWKMDIHALGVSYKIKRLKQQLLVLERLAGAQASKQQIRGDAPSTPEGFIDKRIDENKQLMTGFQLVMSFLNKQAKRYQSLEEKTDDLCRRMHESYRSGSRRDLQNGRTKEQTETLAHFLEDTFQLQRYMVATGQKLMEIQSRITSAFASSSDGFIESEGFNIGQFADIVGTLFREIQKGLEVRIARIIGDIEGTLASDGILHR